MANVRQAADQMSLGFDCNENRSIADQRETQYQNSNSGNVFYLNARSNRAVSNQPRLEPKNDVREVEEKILSSLLVRAKGLNW